MQVSVEKLSNIERRVTIVVPANQVEEAFEKQINRFAKEANLKGFRPGKAPLSYVKERFGDEARKEALSEVIQSALIKALTDEKLQPVSTPQVQPKLSAPNEPLEFTASFEVLPEITNIQCSLEQIDKPNVEISADDVNCVIEQLRKQYTKWKTVTRAAQKNDRVVIDYNTTFEGNAENPTKDFPLELGSNRMLPGFEDGLIGSKAGDEKKLSLNFPADFQIKEHAGKPVEFDVKIKEVFEADMPETDETFVKKLGTKSGDFNELKDQIKQSLEQERARLIAEKLKEQVFKQLLEENPIEVPNSLISREAHSIHGEVYQHQAHDHHNHSQEEMTAFNDIAKKRVTLGLLIAAYARQHNLKIDQSRVMKRIQEIAVSYENPAEVIAWLSAPERKNGLEAQVMEDQVLDMLIQNVPVTEKNMTYAELKGIQV